MLSTLLGSPSDDSGGWNVLQFPPYHLANQENCQIPSLFSIDAHDIRFACDIYYGEHDAIYSCDIYSGKTNMDSEQEKSRE